MQGPLAPESLDLYREPILVGLVALAAALFVVTLLFSAYAVALRWQNQRRDARRAALAERWQPALLDVLAHPERAELVHRLVEEKRRLHFVGFVLQFARRMRGQEVDALRKVVQPYLGLVAERLESGRVEVRARAVQTLGTLGLPEHEDAVIGALDDPSPLVAMVAARALTREEDPDTPRSCSRRCTASATGTGPIWRRCSPRWGRSCPRGCGERSPTSGPNPGRGP